MAASEPRRARRRGVPVALLTGAVVGGLGTAGYLGVRSAVDASTGPRCEFRVQDRTETFTPAQPAQAATITAVATRRGLPARAASIALATAIQESKLRNLSYGDRDSLGLFQQRPSQGWGSPEQVQDPVYASNAFYDALTEVDGWEHGVITEVAQQVQRSGYPEAYADHEWEGRVLASVLSGQAPGGMGCRLDDPQDPSTAQQVAEKVEGQLGLDAGAQDAAVTVEVGTEQAGWAVAGWAVAHAEAEGITSVTVGDRTWTRSRADSSLRWQDAQGPTDGSSVVRIELPQSP